MIVILCACSRQAALCRANFVRWDFVLIFSDSLGNGVEIPCDTVQNTSLLLLLAFGNGVLKSKHIVGSRRVIEFQKAVSI